LQRKLAARELDLAHAPDSTRDGLRAAVAVRRPAFRNFRERSSDDGKKQGGRRHRRRRKPPITNKIVRRLSKYTRGITVAFKKLKRK